MEEAFNTYYVKIVENTNGKKPCDVSETTDIDNDRAIFRLILYNYKNHPSVLAIKQNSDCNSQTLSIKEVEAMDIALSLKNLDAKKSTGDDQIPPKFVPVATNKHTVPGNAKKAMVSPLDKGGTES